MSSKALKLMQGKSDLEILAEKTQAEVNEEDESDDDYDSSAIVTKKKKNQKKKKGNYKGNLFELLNDNLANSEDEDEGDDDDDGKLKDKEEAENGVKEEEQQVTPVTKVKKKKKKKGKGKENSTTEKKNSREPVDEVEASLEEVNRMLGEPGMVSSGANAKLTLVTSPLLQVDYRNLNPETELKRIFGAEVVQAERPSSHRGRRNQPATRRSGKLVQPKDSWHSTSGSGLSMVNLGGDKGFTYVHSSLYQDLQYTYYEAVQSGNPENIFTILRSYPYHIDTLIQMAEFYRMNEDIQTGAQCIEKALFGLESSFDVMFNMATGNCLLDYRRHENRALHICLFKHILNIGRRGCYRTAFEFCKLLLSLDRRADPLNTLYLIDFYAIRSSQYEFLIRLWQETKDSPSSVLERVNFALSIPLALFHTACSKNQETTEADELLQDRLLMYPVVLKPLLTKCSVQPDKRVDNHPFFNSNEIHNERGELGRIVKMVVERCYPCWKEIDVMAWLERNVQKVLDIVDKGQDHRIKLYATKREARFKGASLCLLRHYILCEISDIGLPRSVLNVDSKNLMVTDPFPPTDSITVYTSDHKRPNVPPGRGGDVRNRNVLGLLLQSLLPTYDQNAPPEVNEVDHEVEGARAIPQQIQNSVNTIMDAMRALLTDLRGPEDIPAAPDMMAMMGEDNEQEWAEEEDDYNNEQGGHR